MRQPLVAGNWKMNGSRSSVAELLGGLKDGMGQVKTAEVAVCAPAIYIPQVQAALSGSAIKWGGQDVSVHESGAYTGEIAGPMLRDFDCHFVIIGHSERRAYHGESDQAVAEKFAAARKAGLVPILCVGETLEDGCREGGRAEAVDAQGSDVGQAVEQLADVAHRQRLRRVPEPAEPGQLAGRAHGQQAIEPLESSSVQAVGEYAMRERLGPLSGAPDDGFENQGRRQQHALERDSARIQSRGSLSGWHRCLS